LIPDSQDSEVFDIMFKVMCGIRSHMYVVSLPQGESQRFHRLVHQGVASENLRGHLLEIGVSRDDASRIGVTQHRLCWFIHTSKTLRELIRMGKEKRVCEIQELMLLTERDTTVVRGYGMIEPNTLKDIAALLDPLKRCTFETSIPIREAEQLHALGRLQLDEPFLVLLISKDAYTDSPSESKRDSSAPTCRTSDSHPPSFS